MTFTAPDLSDILEKEQSLNSRLSACKSELQTILTNEEIGYTAGDGIIPLIRKLPYPVPTSIELYGTKDFLTKSGPQTYNKSMDLSCVVRDQNGNAMRNVPVTIRRRAGTTSGAWTVLGNLNTGEYLTVTPESNTGNFRYEAYVTTNSSISTYKDVPNYYMYYPSDEYYLQSIVSTTPLASSNCRIDYEPFSMGADYINLYAQSAGTMYAVFPLRNYPPLTGVNSNTKLRMGFDITRGDVPSATKIIGLGGGMYNASNSNGGSMGLFLDASDADSLTSRTTSFVASWAEDHGFTQSGVSKECYIEIPGTSNGGYPYMYGEGGTPSDYMAYWYGQYIGTPVVLAWANNLAANERVRLKMKYIMAVTP